MGSPSITTRGSPSRAGSMHLHSPRPAARGDPTMHLVAHSPLRRRLATTARWSRAPRVAATAATIVVGAVLVWGWLGAGLGGAAAVDGDRRRGTPAAKAAELIAAAGRVAAAEVEAAAADGVLGAAAPSRHALDTPATKRAAAAAAAAAVATAAPAPAPAPAEADMAIFLQVSAKSLPLFPRLLARIHHPRNTYAVHFDAAIPDADLAPVLAAVAATPAYGANVVIMQRSRVTYRGISLVLNTLDAMEVALRSPVPWTYWLNLSGADYPLLPIAVQRRLLGGAALTASPRTFFSIVPAAAAARNAEARLGHLHVDPAVAFLGDTPPPSLNATPGARGGGLAPVRATDGGWVGAPLYPAVKASTRQAEAWMVLHRGFVDYAARSPAARRTLLVFAYATTASKHFFISLAAASVAWRPSIVTNCLRDVRWKFRGRTGGQHPLTVDAVERAPAPDGDARGGDAADDDGAAADDDARAGGRNGSEGVRGARLPAALRLAAGAGVAYPFEAALVGSPKWYARKFGTPNSPLMDRLDAAAGRPEAVAAAERYLAWLLAGGDGSAVRPRGSCDGATGDCV
ncbi:hypothetical protein BU14_0014s0049 [Porphyra umbilicalis]|uniref:Protein xylosyltransferase n=1 Tax=Porphyra umbilicalis TaxID=2786 RepID=A0A1X6PKW7_PORUM|nr:hypothetical protein BU14_0014s0049 [Porphyra umbilicalis]|eukprot:OSX81499.1 hypothetical protein BU14_0014s0049 [Porphyra umbilicalis]